jgi:hypothetical protein
LNLHHHNMALSSNRLTSTLYCYKKIIPILATFSITQSHLYFTPFLAKVLRRQSFIRSRRSLASLSHAHCPSTVTPTLTNKSTIFHFLNNLSIHVKIYFKKIISILTTFSTTQSHLYFTPFLAKVLRHQSSTRSRRSLASLSHAHCPSTQ